MRLRLTVERSGDLEIEVDLYVDIPAKNLMRVSPDMASSAVDLLKHQLLACYPDLVARWER